MLILTPMSPEHRIVLNKREGRRFRQLYINKETLIPDRVAIVADYFSVEIQQIEKVVEDVGKVLTGNIESVLSEEERERNSGRRLDNYFERKLYDLGISINHSRKLVLGVVDHLALLNGRRRTLKWLKARVDLLDILHQKI